MPRLPPSSAGLAEGVHARKSRKARRAIGSAGWGHLGIFERMKQDNIPWEITVWHWHGDDLEWALRPLAQYGKPIWITELAHPYGSQRDGEDGQARGLAGEDCPASPNSLRSTGSKRRMSMNCSTRATGHRATRLSWASSVSTTRRAALAGPLVSPKAAFYSHPGSDRREMTVQQ